MCGIVGYVGTRSAAEVIVGGLKRLEYRGYDSTGIAVVDGDLIELRRTVGKVTNLATLVEEHPAPGTVGLGHTRWATHGRPSEANAHPHADCTGCLVVVHNGILENYLSLKERLLEQGHRFRSETDTEVIAHLVESYVAHGLSLTAAARAALREVRGAYAIGILSAAASRQLIVAKHGAGAVVVGLGEGDVHVASDIPALLPHTRDVVLLEDGEMAVVTSAGACVTTLDGRSVERAPARITWNAAAAEKGGYRHFMLKEIFEQPRAVAETFLGRVAPESGTVSIPETNLTPEVIGRLRRVFLVACGTSYHAALVGRIMVERLAGLPADAAVASEFRYSELLLGADTLVVAISQSGETADTVGAVKMARQLSSDDPVDYERGRLRHCTRVGWCALHPRWPGDWCGLQQDVHRHAHRLLPSGAGPRARPRVPNRGGRPKAHRGPPGGSTPDGCGPGSRPGDRGAGPPPRGIPAHALPRPRGSASGRTRASAQAQGDFLRSRGRIRGGRDEARPDRADRRGDASGCSRSTGPHL